MTGIAGRDYIHVRDASHHHSHQPLSRECHRRASSHHHGQRFLVNGASICSPVMRAEDTFAQSCHLTATPPVQVANNVVDVDGVPCVVRSASSTKIVCLTSEWTRTSEPSVGCCNNHAAAATHAYVDVDAIRPLADSCRCFLCSAEVPREPRCQEGAVLWEQLGFHGKMHTRYLCMGMLCKRC